MNQHQIKNKVIEKIIGVIVLVVAVAAVVTAGYFYVKSQNSRSWPAAEGVITKSSTRIQRNPGDSGAPATIADVWYSYIVDGIEHHNDTISHAQYGSSSARHAVQEARRYPVGSRVLVYYDPGNPHDSVLEHKTPWIFIGIFGGLGTILIFIGVGMLSGGFTASRSAAAKRYGYHTAAYEKKAPAATGTRRMITALFLSTLIVFMGFYFYLNKKNETIVSTGQVADYLPESGEPHPVSTYSKTKTSLPCGESLKAEVAQRQKIDLDDGIHALYVTATLCIEEEEMKAASQSHLTWPTIAGHLAAYDKAVFDPESALLGSGEENATEAFVMRLKRIENESLQRLHENGIFFVKAIQFDYLQVFKAD
ncbi:MAG: DUF3592 domain-containing protein [Desulfobacteraceae bacterium]